ncbi:MAG: tetratricopeptide repeat protein [Planctomycetaceae bacterium]
MTRSTTWFVLSLASPRRAAHSLPRQSLLAGLCWLLLASLTFGDAIDDYNVALKFYKDQRWEQAEAAFDRFLATHPGHDRAPAARLYLGQSRIYQQEFSGAREAFRTFVQTHPEHPDVYLAIYRVAESSYFLGDFKAARTELDRFISKYPDHELAEYALYYLGDAQLRAEDPQGAIKSLQLQRERFPTGRLADDALFLQARATALAGQRPQAQQLLATLAAKTASPRAPDAQLELGMLLYQDQRFADARDAFKQVRSRFENSKLVPTADLNGGYANYHLGDYDAAIACFDRAQESAEQAPEASFWKGMSLKSKGEFAPAADTFLTLVKTSPDPGLALRALFHAGDSQLRDEKHTDAIASFLRVADADPQGPLAPDALHLATEAALQHGDLAEAERLHTRFVQNYADSGLALLQRLLYGRILLGRGDKAVEGQDAPSAQKQFDAAASVFAEVIAQSQVERTTWLARILLARTQDRLENYTAIEQTLTEPVRQLAQPGAADEFAEALVLLSRAQLKLGHNTEAAATARQMIDRFPQHAQIDEAYANLALAAARLDEAEELAAALDKLWSDPAYRTLAQRVTYQLGDQSYQQREWTKAAEHFARLVQQGGGQYQTAALSGLGYARYQDEKFAEAAEAFGQLIASGTPERVLASDAAHLRALALKKAEQPQAAVDAYKAAIRQFGLAPTATNLTTEDQQVGWNVYQAAKGLARLERDQQQVDAADQAYQTAFDQLQLLPAERQAELDQLLQEWAILHYEQKDYDRSDALYARLVELRPESPLADDAKLFLAESHYFAERLVEARKAFEDVADDANVDEFVGQRALTLLLDMAAAREDWQDVIRVVGLIRDRYPASPEIPYASYRLGEAYLKTGDNARAIAEIEPLHASTDATVRGAAWFASARVLLAEAYLREKQYANVEQVVTAFREQHPAAPLLYQADEVLGRRFKNEARFEEARAAFRRVVDSESGRRTETAAKAQLEIAETYLLEENLGDAVTEYTKVYLGYDFPEYQAPALLKAGECDAQRGRWADAAKTLETLVTEFPENEYATQAKPLLDEARTKAGTAGTPTPEPTPLPGTGTPGSTPEPEPEPLPDSGLNNI